MSVEWLKMCVHTHKHTHDGIYSAIKKNEIMPAATGMDLEIIILSEVSHRETNIMCCHSCGI